MVKHLSGSAQLLDMTLEHHSPARTIVLGPSEAGWPHALYPRILEGHYLYTDYSIYRRDLEQLRSTPLPGLELRFTADEGEVEEAERIVVVLPKSKEAMRAAFTQASSMATAESAIWVVGPKKGGISSAAKLVREFLGEITESSSARHAKLLQVEEATATPSYENQKIFEVKAFGQKIKTYSSPGVFSHGRLDVGTQFLLENLPPPDFKNALDMGCGSGIIGTALKKLRPESSVDLVDSSSAALIATRKTLRENGFDAKDVWASDLFSQVQRKYDLIISNPPFHQGIKTNFGVTNQLISDAARYLKKKGRLVLVTNTFIDYFKVLRPVYSHVETLAENTRFRIIEARP
tara:strand:- start:1131 stop:2174 length:1044 start_codon:yes stop_codon:yes gene_type:complete